MHTQWLPVLLLEGYLLVSVLIAYVTLDNMVGVDLDTVWLGVSSSGIRSFGMRHASTLQKLPRLL